MLSAKNIAKSFDDREIIKDISLDIAPGTITCLIGPSGTGKTTLLRALSLLDYPDTGTIAVDETAYVFPLSKKEKIAPPWPQVTTVFQSLFLWPHLSLRENIMLPARNHNENAEKDIEGLINFFEMAHFIDRYPNQTSVGQRQRAALARALILNPRYILLDEITSALDVEQTAKILEKLTHLRERGIGVLLITHALSFARKASDKIIFMADGTIAEQGNHTILEKPSSERLADFIRAYENS